MGFNVEVCVEIRWRATQLCMFPYFVLFCFFSSSRSVVHTVTRERRGLPQTRPNSASFRLYPRLAYHLTREICSTANEKENSLFARPLIWTMGGEKREESTGLLEMENGVINLEWKFLAGASLHIPRKCYWRRATRKCLAWQQVQVNQKSFCEGVCASKLRVSWVHARVQCQVPEVVDVRNHPITRAAPSEKRLPVFRENLHKRMQYYINVYQFLLFCCYILIDQLTW